MRSHLIHEDRNELRKMAGSHILQPGSVARRQRIQAGQWNIPVLCFQIGLEPEGYIPYRFESIALIRPRIGDPEIFNGYMQLPFTMRFGKWWDIAARSAPAADAPALLRIFS